MTGKLKIASGGEMIVPSVHDANLLGIVLADPGTLYIPMRLIDGASVCIVLRGVVRLRADDFRQGNVVLDITVSGAGVRACDLQYVYGVDQAGKSELGFLVTVEEDFSRGKLKLVEINASYGCSLSCVCEEIDVIEECSILGGHMSDFNVFIINMPCSGRLILGAVKQITIS